MLLPRAVVFLSLAACGGKLASTADPPAPPVQPEPAADPAPDPEPVVPSTCSRPRLTTTDYGVLDVSKLGCECTSDRDCPRGSFCIEFPAMEAPRCAPTDDPCKLLRCDDGACVVLGSSPSTPTCYR